MSNYGNYKTDLVQSETEKDYQIDFISVLSPSCNPGDYARLQFKNRKTGFLYVFDVSKSHFKRIVDKVNGLFSMAEILDLQYLS